MIAQHGVTSTHTKRKAIEGLAFHAVHFVDLHILNMQSPEKALTELELIWLELEWNDFFI